MTRQHPAIPPYFRSSPFTFAAGRRLADVTVNKGQMCRRSPSAWGIGARKGAVK